ncbi:unnamed protein product [Alternaria sp. RS040]
MAPNSSHLSDSKYRYDLVVATTQESINAGLLQYLQNTNANQPYQYLFYMVDEEGATKDRLTLAQLLAKSGNVNPFDIPTDTPTTDPRIEKLFDIRFQCGVRLRAGIPPGLMQNVTGKGPQIKLPAPIVTLGNSANNVIFNIYCSDVSVIVFRPPGGYNKGSWKWYSQPSGTPWYVTTRTDITSENLDKTLNTPYFNNNPEQKKQLLARLNNLSGSAFSLQQLLFNLDSAVAQTVPSFVGVDDKEANHWLSLCFADLWAAESKEQGLPLVGVTAVAQYPDGSPLRLTGLTRYVSPVLDPSTGAIIKDPTPLEVSATTLNYLCATGRHPLPGATSFSWNWIDPQEISQSSGVMAVKRDIIAAYFVDQMLPQARKSCIEPRTDVDAYDAFGGVRYSWGFTRGMEPSVRYHNDGATVASLAYSHETRASDSNIATYGELNITSTYTCDIVSGVWKFLGITLGATNEFAITHNLKISVYCQWAASGTSANVVDKTLYDVYVVSVDSNGNLKTDPRPDPKKHTLTDKSESGDASGIINFFIKINDLIDDVKGKSQDFLRASINPIPFDKLQNFVFPGARVFSYKSASFSDYQDLVSLITYVNPTDDQFSRTAAIMEAGPVTAEKSFQMDEVPAMAVAIEQARAKGMLGPALAVHQDVEHAQKTAFSTTTEQSGFEQCVVKSDAQGFTIVAAESGDKANGTSRPYPLAARASIPMPGSSLGGRLQISSITEMMLNYVQGQLVDPRGEFRALQMANGTPLLFAINASKALNIFREVLGESQTGWVVDDISSATVEQAFGTGATVEAFGVNQSVMDEGTIGLGMAVRKGGSDTLFLSLSNAPDSTSSWTSHPSWRAFPFDAPKGPHPVQITKIMFSETDQGIQYIMVDILQNPSSSLKTTVRYIVDPSSTTTHWIPHTLPFDVEKGTYSSCIGRVAHGMIDGIYTAGTVQGAPQLAYVPIFNLSGDAAPMATRLTLPSQTPAMAIASMRHIDKFSALYGTTDLYAIGKSTLYRWAADEQLKDGTAGKPIMTNELLSGTDSLTAMTHDETITLSDPQAWRIPVPILSNVERIASFCNIRDGGNTVFAAGGNRIQRVIQATNTESKIWQSQPITLSAPPQQKALSFRSYTTTIKVTDTDGMLSPGTQVTMTTPSRTPVYIEGLYYILSPVPVVLNTNNAGQITIIQATESIIGTLITATVEGATSIVNPMEQSLAKLSALTDRAALRRAEFTTNTIAGGVRGPKQTAPLISPSVTNEDLDSTAECIRKLKEAYVSTNKMPLSSTAPAAIRNAPDIARTATFGLGDYIRVAAGDLFNWLRTGVNHVIQVIKDVASGAWQFVVNIAGKVYHAVLDSVSAIVGALEWVFNQIKTALEDLIQFLEVLFQWDDIKRTKQIMHNMIRFYLQNSVEGIRDVQRKFDASIAGAQMAVAEWSGMENWNSLGDSAAKPPSGNATNPTKDHTPSSQMMANHFQNNAHSMTFQGQLPKPSLVQSLLGDLMTALAAEGKVFQETYNQLKDLASDLLSLSLTDVLRRLAGILTETVLGTTQVVGDALFNVIYHLSSSAIDLLDTKIHVPILSDILNGIGVPDISFLDLITWIGATGITVIYKLANDGNAPFPDNVTSRTLINARNWTEFATVFKPNSSPSLSAKATAIDISGASMGSGLVKISESVGTLIYSSGHALAGFVAFAGNFLFFAEAMDPSPDNVFGIPSAVIGVIGAVAAAGADALVAKMPLENEAVDWIGKGTSALTITSKLVFSGFVQDRLDAGGKLKFLKVDDNRQTGAIVNSCFVFPALFCTCFHFYELSKKPEGKERSCAIIGETSQMVSCFGQLAYTTAVLDPDPATRVVPAGVMAGCNIVLCGLETGAALVL